ncbi:hypothetical protein KO507_06925 [Gilvimarinus agarilyticus]|uniref:hypothetical protein n=1 Tax=unclassified Gilvimarinus TaxID=2642066 RepID=UPI001C0920AC|nr:MULTISPECIES: hypothetical protein [unclassified Gilvimarinus]MBU2885490.1 hypothetical protein [Gilvimarinus agarilyticus]MDO6570390.1 hypothetical protein [Gilvimarinus sp. 2_MG-2023]MDO6748436.1 hypothetical protein [Gilvimarinus sp. 1_MG-2023]
MLKKIAVCLGTLALLATTVASAAPGQGRGKPPQEAFDACIDKVEGDSVQIETPHGDTLEAICKEMEDGLVGVPADRPERR